MKRALLLFPAIVLLCGTAYAKDLFVQSAKAKLMGEPTFKAAVVATVQRGDRLEQTEEKDGWFKVKAAAGAGWVYNLAVAANPPMEKVTIITADAAELAEKSRKRASAITSAAAARGLSDAERKRLSDMGAADYRALRNLEESAGAISDKEVLEFEAGR